MSITVEHMLKLPEMGGITIAAGALGLTNEISSVNVMEVPDISRYLKRGELLITTLYSILDDESKLREFLPMLCKKGVAALAVAPLYEHTDIPDFMLVQANEMDFPLLKIPYGTPFNDLINSVMHGIITQFYRSGLIEDILNGKITNLSQALTIGRSYNWNLKGAFIPALFNGDAPISLPSEVIVVGLKTDSLFIFPLDSLRNEKKLTDEIKGMMLNHKYACLGIGRAIENILLLPIGFTQAQQALKLAKRLKKTNSACYGSLGIYRVLYSDDDVEKQAFAEEILGDMHKDDELIKTLRVYFNEMGNHRSAAKALYVHYNTVANRLGRIEHLTGRKLDNAEDCLCLQIALKIYDLTNL